MTITLLQLRNSYFHQEICKKAEVAGCFISLSGVNGHVQGNYDELCRNTDRISLFHGDQLLSLISEIIPFVSLQEISQQVQRITPRTVSRLEPAYHEDCVYWIVVFSGGGFSIFTNNGIPVADDIATKLTPMIKSELDVSSFVDVQAEIMAEQRAKLARTTVIVSLFNGEGSISSLSSFTQLQDYSIEELQNATQKLISSNLLGLDDGGRCFIPISTDSDGECIPVELYQYLFESGFHPDILCNNFYQQHINRSLLNRISTIQGGLPFLEADVPRLIQLLQLSPSALQQALTPMPIIVNGRKIDDVPETVTRFHQSYFHQKVLESFKHDFRTRELSVFFHEHKGLTEIETTTSLILKSHSKIEHESSFSERIRIARLDNSLGGGLVHVRLLDNAPQPWESFSAASEEKNCSSSSEISTDTEDHANQ